jgi:hypothetical protein
MAKKLENSGSSEEFEKECERLRRNLREFKESLEK